MQAVQLRLIAYRAGEDGRALGSLQSHAVEHQAEVVADLAAEHELVVLIARSLPRA